MNKNTLRFLKVFSIMVMLSDGCWNRQYYFTQPLKLLRKRYVTVFTFAWGIYQNVFKKIYIKAINNIYLING